MTARNNSKTHMNMAPSSPHLPDTPPSFNHCSQFHPLQDIGSKAEETGKAGSRAGNGAVCGTSESSSTSLGGGGASGSSLGSWGGSSDGGVDVNWGLSRDDSRWDRGQLAHSAWAVGDGQSLGLGSSVRNTIEGECSRRRAHGGEDSDHVGDPDSTCGGVGGSRSAGHEGSGGGSVGELHVDDLGGIIQVIERT